MQKLTISCLLLSILFCNNIISQELKANISVNATQIQGSNKDVFDDMQKNLQEFLNTRNWTSHLYTNEERIECNFMITISEISGTDMFKGSLQITSSRPVYNSSYKSPLLNHIDKQVSFTYTEGETLEFSTSSHNELSSLIAYYVYIILGLDYDSFAPQGGTKYFETAQEIVSNAQSSQYSGWKSYEDNRNRYWLAENYLNSIYYPLRDFSYTMHRKGLDKMSEKTVDARSAIAMELPALLKVHRQKPNSIAMMTFFNAKSDELIDILSESQGTEAQRAVNILKEVDETNASKYDNILKKE